MARYTVSIKVTQIFDDSGGSTTREAADAAAKANITAPVAGNIVAVRIGKAKVLSGDSASSLDAEAANVLSEHWDG